MHDQFTKVDGVYVFIFIFNNLFKFQSLNFSNRLLSLSCQKAISKFFPNFQNPNGHKNILHSPVIKVNLPT